MQLDRLCLEVRSTPLPAARTHKALQRGEAVIRGRWCQISSQLLTLGLRYRVLGLECSLVCTVKPTSVCYCCSNASHRVFVWYMHIWPPHARKKAQPFLGSACREQVDWIRAVLLRDPRNHSTVRLPRPVP